ncbi:MAG: hypothetical protein JST31_12180 [Actinobacteria bacterium]|nr:hypothetical protein [Actinomycetota bacterium]
MVATIALALILAAPSGAAAAPPNVGASTFHVSRQLDAALVWLPGGTTVAQLAEAGLAPGLMGAGLGTVPAVQTYLDVGQGNRVFDSLYGESLPPTPSAADRPGCRRWFAAAVRRAESAPAEIEPGLLDRELRAGGVSILRAGPFPCAFGGPAAWLGGTGGGRQFAIVEATLGGLRQVLAAVSRRTLVIAVARPTGRDDQPLPIGIAGPGFDGDLTSPTTRTNGYVLSTDLAPTVLTHFGISVPSQMTGQPISSEGAVDPAGIVSLRERMAVVSPRRGPVIGLSLLAWVAALVMVAAASRGGAARVAVRLMALSVIYLPLLLLLGAALEPAETVEMLVVMVGSPLLAALTLALVRGYRALAVAAGLTAVAYAADAIAGSPLSSLSLLGPNPGLGVRFYGIGNELEAMLVVLVVAGTGAGLVGFAPRATPRAAAASFLGLGLFATLIFAAGRFGADVGAALDIPAGAAVAALVVAGGRRRAAALVVAIPFAMLALLALIDLVSGANAHLTRSILDAGGLHSLGDLAQRRFELSVRSFGRPVLLVFLPLVAALAALAVWRRDLLASWLRGLPAMRAGLLGAVAGTIVGTLANDSGALLLVIGAAYLLVFGGYAWAESQIGVGDADNKLRSAHHGARVES